MKLVLLAALFTALSFNSLTAQRLEFLNKHFFQVYDTLLYEYNYYKVIQEDSFSLKTQTYSKNDKVKISQYTLIKDEKGENKAELTMRFYENGKLKYTCKRDFVTDEELIKEYYDNGNLKSEVNTLAEEVVLEKYLSGSGEITSKPILGEGLPKDGIAGWNAYLAKTLRYPVDARLANQEGKVIIAFDLSEDGEILNPEVANPEEIHASLGKEALRAVKNYKDLWTPFTLDGIAQIWKARLPVMFKLTD